jgi:hypothetical protein
MQGESYPLVRAECRRFELWKSVFEQVSIPIQCWTTCFSHQLLTSLGQRELVGPQYDLQVAEALTALDQAFCHFLKCSKDCKFFQVRSCISPCWNHFELAARPFERLDINSPPTCVLNPAYPSHREKMKLKTPPQQWKRSRLSLARGCSKYLQLEP